MSDFGVELVAGRVYHGLADVSTYGMQSLVGCLATLWPLAHGFPV
jgi:hypothetical protein